MDDVLMYLYLLQSKLAVLIIKGVFIIYTIPKVEPVNT